MTTPKKKSPAKSAPAKPLPAPAAVSAIQSILKALAERKQKEAELVELRKLEAETKEKAKSLQNELGLH
mgnify:CR=1 FL=1